MQTNIFLRVCAEFHVLCTLSAMALVMHGHIETLPRRSSDQSLVVNEKKHQFRLQLNDGETKCIKRWVNDFKSVIILSKCSHACV